MKSIGRRASACGALSFVVFAALAAAAGSAGGSCVGPSIVVDPSAAGANTMVEVRGSGFGTECNDTGQPGSVLGEPATGIRVRIVQHRVATPLALVNADDRYRFAVRLTLPNRLEAAPATIEAISPGSSRRPFAGVVITSGARPTDEVTTPTTVTNVLMTDKVITSGTDVHPALLFLIALAIAAVAATAYLVRRRS